MGPETTLKFQHTSPLVKYALYTTADPGGVTCIWFLTDENKVNIDRDSALVLGII